MAKEPADRWQTAHDVKLNLQWIQAHGSRVDDAATAAVARKRTACWLWAAAAASVALAATALALLLSSPPTVVTQAPQVRFDLTLPRDMQMSLDDNGATSPDGRRDLSSTDLMAALKV